MKNFINRASVVLFVFIAGLFVTPLLAADKDADMLEYEGKIAVYKQAMKDVALQQLNDQVKKNPHDSRLMDQLLIHMPLSPLDAFRIRMELNHTEYIVPQQVMDLHRRWLQLHPEVGIFQPQMQSSLQVESAMAPLMLAAATVSTNRNVAATYTPAPTAYDGEIQLAVNRSNTNQMVAGANTWDTSAACSSQDQIQSIFSSIDGGATWRHTCAPTVGTFGSTTLSCQSGEIRLGSDPAVYWDDQNNVYFNYMLMCCDSTCQAGTGNPRSSMVVAKSTDSGLTWTRQGVVVNDLATGNTNFDDKQFYAIDNNPGSPYYHRHYSCWDQNNNNKFAYSTNSGASFTMVDLPSPGGANSELGCDIAVKKDGTVYEIFNELTCGSTCTAEATYFTKSTNGGASWSTPVLIKSHRVYSNFGGSANKIQAANSRGINPFGSIDVDNSGGANDGRIYVTYSDMASGTDMNLSDMYVNYSTDAGATWSHETKVNDDTTSTAQFEGTLVVDQSNGNVIVGWYDGRNDTTSKRKIDIYMSRSTDGGNTWEANTKVTSASSEFTNNTGISYTDENSTDNTGANPNNYGEYLGVDVVNGTAFMAWTDSRPYFPSGTTNAQKENVGFASMTFTTSSDTTPPTTSLTAPTAGATLSGVATVSANASDNVGVTNVEFYAGSTLIGSDTTSPYSISWDTTTVANGSYNLTSKAYDAAGNSASSTAVSVTVSNVAGPPALTATYNGTYKAPACGSGGKSCDSGPSLLNGRANISGGAETNQPNTINTSCADGTSGTYHSDESNDRLLVATNDGTALAGGKAVTVTATVWCYGTTDSLDLYYTSSIPGSGSPTWTLIRTQACAVSGQSVAMTGTYTLPASGTVHAVRANYRYQGSASSCSTGSYDDHDDLVFGVNQTADTTAPTTSITAPSNGATVANTVTVSASASDNVGVTKVEIYIDSTLKSTINTSPYNYNWNTTTYANGSHTIYSKAYDAANNVGTSGTITVTVNNTATPPDLTATYSATYKAPACAAGGKSCDTGATLINGRGTMTNGNETNRPNTINSSCADGNSGTYHSDESLDRMKIATNDSSAFAAGKAVTITYTVYCYSSADHLDIYYTSNATTPTWTSLGTQNCTAAGVKTFTATYTLPSGANQAVRGNFRYNGSAASCSTGSYDDHDDLVFGVN